MPIDNFPEGSMENRRSRYPGGGENKHPIVEHVLHLVLCLVLMWGTQGWGMLPFGKRKISPETAIRLGSAVILPPFCRAPFLQTISHSCSKIGSQPDLVLATAVDESDLWRPIR